MSWKEQIRRGLTCPKCHTPNSFTIVRMKGKKGLYKCSECDHKEVIG